MCGSDACLQVYYKHGREKKKLIKQTAAVININFLFINFKSLYNTTVLDIMDQWENQDNRILLLNTLEYLDVVTLIQKKPVCKQWQEICTNIIDNKCVHQKQFKSNDELKAAGAKYCNGTDTEDLACTYGYPINKWNVSNINDLSGIFESKTSFNEDLSSWDVSNVTNMEYMFADAESFNQDISSWNVSNVTNMACMFAVATEFNGDISSWDVSNVTDMRSMFHNATSFNQDISSWDVSNVTNMEFMFRHAASFNQDISSWDVANLHIFYAMFVHCPVVNVQQFPWFSDNMLQG